MSVIRTSPVDLLRTPRRYDDLVALATAEHAVKVYGSAAEYGFEAMSAGFEGGTVVESGPAQIGLSWSPEAVVVAPRGSDEPGDWIGNLASVVRWGWLPYLPKGCRAGLGFRSQARRAAPLVLGRLRQLLARRPAASVILTGHSLGAAVVPLLVAYLHHHGIDIRVAYMHEPPRPGNLALATWYDRAFTAGSTPTYTVVNVVGGEADLVTRVPLKRHGARHLGRCVIHSQGHKLHGWGAWARHREANPVGYIAAWRVITRTAAAIRAHLGGRLLETLRGNVQAE